MKAAGAPLETSEHSLLGMPDLFRRKPVAPEVATCRIGLSVFSINPSGMVSFLQSVQALRGSDVSVSP